MIEEQLLIHQLKQGKEAAYRFLYEKHYAVLCHLAREWVGDDYTAETLVGDVIFHLWEIRESLDIRVSLRSYLLQAVRNRCLDHLPRAGSAPRLPFRLWKVRKTGSSPCPSVISSRTTIRWAACWSGNWSTRYTIP